MKCELCNQNEATILAIRISNGIPQEIHICEECAYQNGDSNNFAIPISFQDFFQAIVNMINVDNNCDYNKITKEESELKCEVCGMTYSEFKNVGKLGCDNCYKTFKELDSLLKNIHGNTHHLGKVPSKNKDEFVVKREIAFLREKLNEAIRLEEYEEAAKLRDKIRVIEKGE